jgi:four helix bundle protein
MNAIEHFGAYRKATELFDHVVEDLAALRENFSLGRLISQQIASADSICANIEEGCGRLSRQEYIRFLDFARGSARETRGRYLRMHHWLNAQTIEQRVSLLDEIIGILTAAINTLKRQSAPASSLHEEPIVYEAVPRHLTPGTISS